MTQFLVVALVFFATNLTFALNKDTYVCSIRTKGDDRKITMVVLPQPTDLKKGGKVYATAALQKKNEPIDGKALQQMRVVKVEKTDVYTDYFYMEGNFNYDEFDLEAELKKRKSYDGQLRIDNKNPKQAFWISKDGKRTPLSCKLDYFYKINPHTKDDIGLDKKKIQEMEEESAPVESAH